MAGTSFQVDMTKLKKDFKEMQDRLARPSLIGESIAGKAWADVDDHFRKSQGPDKQWPGITYRQGKPLLDTGRLRMSIRDRITNDEVILWTNLEYAAVHNYGFGDKNKKGVRMNIPERKFLWLSSQAVIKIGRILMDFIVTGKK